MLEHRLAADPEIKKYVRAKRNINNLPDPWDTQFISIQKCWKWRCRKAKQWMKHKLSLTEVEDYHLGQWFEIEYHGHIIRMQDHEKWIFTSEDGCVWASDTDPAFYTNLRSKRFLKVYARHIPNINVQNGEVIKYV